MSGFEFQTPVELKQLMIAFQLQTLSDDAAAPRHYLQAVYFNTVSPFSHSFLPVRSVYTRQATRHLVSVRKFISFVNLDLLQ